jgi:hypothetical protein
MHVPEDGKSNRLVVTVPRMLGSRIAAGNPRRFLAGS